MARAAAHATFNGYSSYVQGGNFWHGAAAGGIGSAVGSGIHAGANRFGWSQSGTNLAMVGGGAVSGGISSSIAGGDFWQGFGIAATVGLVNHVAHNGWRTDPVEKINMALASDQEIIDQFAYALKLAKMDFEVSGGYSPINLREYFTGFPTSKGATHIFPEGYLCGVPVKFEIPIKYYLARVNWGGPSRTANWQSANGRMETWHYNVYGIKGYRLLPRAGIC